MKNNPLLDHISGRHVCLVHQYIPGDNSHQVWYHQWGLNVLYFLGSGFEQLGAKVKVVDVDSLLKHPESILNGVDYSVNLVCGNMNISNWALVPSISTWFGVTPLPNSAESTLAGERKDTANLIAKHSGLKVPDWSYYPRDLLGISDKIIRKPRDFGSSHGLELIDKRRLEADVASGKGGLSTIYQEFIPGIDVTLPVIFNPFDHGYTFGHAVAFMPKSSNSNWMLDATAKSINRVGEKIDQVQKVYYDVPEEVKKAIVKMLRTMGGTSVARVDFRVCLDASENIQACTIDDYFFIEINPVPTMNIKSNFAGGLRSAMNVPGSELEKIASFLQLDRKNELTCATITALSMVSYADFTSTGSG